jgi:hypothetical protein
LHPSDWALSIPNDDVVKENSNFFFVFSDLSANDNGISLFFEPLFLLLFGRAVVKNSIPNSGLDKSSWFHF